jgi:transposase-like protein
MNFTEKDRKMAQHCVTCPLCKRARDKQSGLVYWFVKHIENGLCPYCQAYERVYGKKAHESL